MKQLFSIFILSILSFSLQAQTPKVAHKSHSGTSATFTVKNGNNFGLPPNYEKIIIKQKEKEQLLKEQKKIEQKGGQPLKTKEIQPLSIQGKLKPIEIKSPKTKEKSNPSANEAAQPKQETKPVNRFKIKKGEIKTESSHQPVNWLWFVLLGVIVLVGILPIKSKS